jgi:transcriptional regulator with GAF, ATPase, and Fis domain
MVGSSCKLLKLLSIIQRVARTTSTVLIQGESGTGKELVARSIHVNSPRASRPFVAINCAAQPQDLPDSMRSARREPEPRYSGGVKDSKRQLVTQALEQANGHYIEAARILGLHPNSLLRLIRNLGLKQPPRILPAI